MTLRALLFDLDGTLVDSRTFTGLTGAQAATLVVTSYESTARGANVVWQRGPKPPTALFYFPTGAASNTVTVPVSATGYAVGDTTGTGIQRLCDQPGLICGHASQGHGPSTFNRAQHLDHVAIIDQSMLLIDTDIIDSCGTHQFGTESARQGCPSAKRRLASLPLLAQTG